MMKNKKPAVRFKGFLEDWEEKTLGEMANFTKGRGYSKNDLVETGIPIILYGRLYTNYQTVIDEVDTFALQQQGSIYSNGNEVIIPASGETTEDIARASAVVKSGILLGGDLNVILPSDEINSIFLAINISNGKTQVELSKMAQGKSVVHLRNGDLEKVIITYPNKTEQTQIGNFFKNLDSLITLHQQKYDKLVVLKKAMLEKMFPRNGAAVPEIRFKGFSGDWVERKLGEVADIIDGDRGNNYPNGSELQSMGHTLFLSATNVTTNGFKFNNNQYITEEKSNSLGNGKLITNDIILTSRGSIGHIAWYSDSIEKIVPFARINSGMLILRSKDFMIPSFISQFLNSPLGKKQIDLISFGSAQPQLTKKDISNYLIAFPNKEEQAQIGNYFKNLDHLLTLHQGELEKLKNLKKALLEKMFV
jgi:type I restriction enzyme, S subunit